MSKWYFKTTNASLVGAFQSAPFDIISFDSEGRPSFHTKHDCVGIGPSVDEFFHLLAYNEVSNFIEPFQVFQDDACVVLMTRQRGVDKLGDTWFKVEAGKVGLSVSVDKTQSENCPTPFTHTSTHMIDDVFRQLREKCTELVICHVDGSGSLAYPRFFDLFMNNEADAVTVGLGMEPTLDGTSVYYSASNFHITSSQISNGSIWASSITYTRPPGATGPLTIRSGDVVINGATLNIETEDGKMVVRMGEPGEQYVLRDERDHSVDCVYAPCVW